MVQPRSEYFRAVAGHNLVPVDVIDPTDATIPYWELRTQSELATGMEKQFPTAYKEGSFQCLLIAADKVGR
ncbi:hypothetical protein [Nocardia sp. NPDC049707]|uniref:hypothetical protein n=1 Tax=Nocardia sp. NPDC049707 TaxID=3154735 RepID=UPI0034226454